MKNKGQIGLDTVQVFIVTLLILGVMAIALFIGLNQLINSGAVGTTAESSKQTLSNETITLIDNSTGGIPSTVDGQRVPITYYGLILTNSTSGVVVASGNFTTNSNGTFFSSPTSGYNNTNVNVSGQFTYTVNSNSQAVVSNVTSGTTGFFTNIPTVMTILGAVVIILAVVLIIGAVGRIRNRSEEVGL